MRVDPLSGRQVVIAPRRTDRPGASRPQLDKETPEELERCPFDEGREDRTPPETFALPGGRKPDTPGWQVRVVPNLYPAFERQEVVVHSPRHVRSLADLDASELQLVADAWQQRWSTGLDDGFLYVHALVNEGRAAGASLPHSHSQLVYLRSVPPAALPPLDHAQFQREVNEELRLVAKNDWVAAVCPYVSRVPYELVVAPLNHDEDAFLSPLLGAAFELLADCLRRLRAVEGPVPVNLWLRDTETWCFEVFPRLTILAGIELGAGIYVNPLPPEQAAQALRQAQP